MKTEAVSFKMVKNSKDELQSQNNVLQLKITDLKLVCITTVFEIFRFWQLSCRRTNENLVGCCWVRYKARKFYSIASLREKFENQLIFD